MRKQDFSKQTPGKLVKNFDGQWAYIPSPLPPTLQISREILAATDDATHALGKLAGLGRRMPNPQRLVRMFLRREAELTSKIEQTFAKVQTLVLFERMSDVQDNTPDVGEVANNFKSLDFAIQNLTSRPISLHFLKQMHEILLKDVGGQDQTPGRFRTVQAYIGSTPHLEDARFVPAPPVAIDECMADLVGYLQTPNDLPAVIRTALVHYQFETIHPFGDGNGRVGRALLLVQLISEGSLPTALLNPSAQLERHRQEYYNGLLNVSQDGRWSDWIIFIAKSIAAEARDAAGRIERVLKRCGKNFWIRYVGHAPPLCCPN